MQERAGNKTVYWLPDEQSCREMGLSKEELNRIFPKAPEGPPIHEVHAHWIFPSAPHSKLPKCFRPTF